MWCLNGNELQCTSNGDCGVSFINSSARGQPRESKSMSGLLKIFSNTLHFSAPFAQEIVLYEGYVTDDDDYDISEVFVVGGDDDDVVDDDDRLEHEGGSSTSD